MKILLVYGTTEGHTATLVELMRETIARRGVDVQVKRAGDQRFDIPADVDGVIVGASVHNTKYQAEVNDFVARESRPLDRASVGVLPGLLDGSGS